MNIQDILADLQPLVITYGTKIVLTLLILFIGLKCAKWISQKFKSNLEKRNVDPSLRPFLGGIVQTLLRVLVVISALSTLGIEMTSFAAILAAAGLAIGMALSGTLQNFAGGVVILILKPFKIGDFITAEGHSGVVAEIQIFHTILNTTDNKRIILPNGPVSTGAIVNFSANDTRRVDFTFGIGYGDDIKLAKQILEKNFLADTRVLKDPALYIAVGELADSSVNIIVRAWVNSADYWGLMHQMTEQIKLEFDTNNISIPFPQRDVHMFQAK